MYLTIDKLAKFLDVSVAAIGDNVTMADYVKWSAHFEAMRKTALGFKCKCCKPHQVCEKCYEANNG